MESLSTPDPVESTVTTVALAPPPLLLPEVVLEVVSISLSIIIVISVTVECQLADPTVPSAQVSEDSVADSVVLVPSLSSEEVPELLVVSADTMPELL